MTPAELAKIKLHAMTFVPEQSEQRNDSFLQGSHNIHELGILFKNQPRFHASLFLFQWAVLLFHARQSISSELVPGHIQCIIW